MITGRISIPLAAMAMVLGLSACQATPYRYGDVQPARYAVGACDPVRYASPARCYPRPDRRVYRSYRTDCYSPGCRAAVRHVVARRDDDCRPAYRPYRSAYRYAPVPRGCPRVDGRRWSYRYVAPRPYCDPGYRSSDRRYAAGTYVDDRSSRYRSTVRRYRGSSCCDW